MTTCMGLNIAASIPSKYPAVSYVWRDVRRTAQNRGHGAACLDIWERIFHDGSEEGSAAAQVARVASTVCPSRRVLRFRRGACRYASLADLYCAFGMTFLRGCYHQILGPRRHPPKFSNSLCRYAGACVRLNLHLGWQAAES